MNPVQSFINKQFPDKKYADLRPGWVVKVHQKIKEGDKTRIQAFEGMVITRKHGNEPGATITVRRVSGGFGIEKTFPLNMPAITKIDVVKKSKVHRAKLYYLRDKSQREIRRKTKQEMLVKAIPKTADEALAETIQ
ncbi:MAG: 50S ribosomal protein L19 [Candidatus Yanofskybacteria bacterium RIFCSPHIGHO2_01_FULL_45_42]|uniref:50S ribosomal protein L19 n=3 Tax=Candidatus Yanofskyibacteriota TaxID=1752733 RepID=A0A1F8H4C7_9BACT|nr:MAG: 50S ribosomal protein L19 [Candidatus Yanofskybacteria bacterium RIFCSPHIGHO2_01_FULL_45_42]OGN15479.1 MAG: 50S ribosomal protein L19 [Candidatus Yanofskybacteria bacterium RIFCSPHIGHO2_02_FULL_46_19]OGN27172.1 MAG: 50S ribosomal protein L19 [Candidatus Yanofskybacteria bacterium RIFCSPLOWO2_01_FULL_45_72]OGN31848.1 MAG: 50S ribosomal protein L19 [Candidatus Yanofskybacteria bacterium RIFCSPLOWO2_02_FULL_45_18]